jgi:8-oxo-dGTP diphosphatase
MTQMSEDTDFRGAKLALFIGGQLAVIMRDDKPGLPWAAHLDLPGGGREGAETPEECALRETQEELGLAVSQDDLIWKRQYTASNGQPVWFFAAMLPAGRAAEVRLGDEGQYWTLMPPAEYLTHDRAIPHFATRVADFLATLGAQSA